jgi:hypothetical protein
LEQVVERCELAQVRVEFALTAQERLLVATVRDDLEVGRQRLDEGILTRHFRNIPHFADSHRLCFR